MVTSHSNYNHFFLVAVTSQLLQCSNGETSICVYYTKVTTLEWTNAHLCLLHQSYHCKMDLRALVFITPKLPHYNGLTRTCNY